MRQGLDTPKLLSGLPAALALGWHSLAVSVECLPFLPRCLCLLWDRSGPEGEMEEEPERAGPQKTGSEKVQNQHRPPAVLWNGSKLSTIVSAPKCFQSVSDYCLATVAHHWHQGKSLWMTPWEGPCISSLDIKCRKVSKDKEESFIYRGHLILTVL